MNCIEKIDIAKMRTIINNFETFRPLIGVNDFSNQSVTDIKVLKELLLEFYLAHDPVTGIAQVSYDRRGNKTGRLYSTTVSLQGCKRSLRHTLAKDLYYDVDVKNAHPVFLVWECGRLGLDCKAVKYYIDNRDKCLATLIKKGLTRDQGKTLTLSLLNGGLSKNILGEKDWPKWLARFKANIDIIQNGFCGAHPHLLERAIKKKGKDHWNLKGSALNYRLLDIEDWCLGIMTTSNDDNGRCLVDERVGALVFDGFMLDKASVREEHLPQLLRDWERSVYRNTCSRSKDSEGITQIAEDGVRIELTVKEMDEGFECVGTELNRKELKEMKDEKKALERARIKAWKIKNVAKLLSLDKENPKYEEIKESGFVKVSHLNNGIRIVVISSPLGSGKSYAVGDHLKDHGYDTIVVMTPRISYAVATHSRLTRDTSIPFKIYTKLKGVINSPYIVVQAESLNRLDLDAYVGGRSLLLVDECEAFLTQLTCKETHGEKMGANVEAFEKLLRGSSKCFLLDAFISNRTVGMLESLKLDYHLFDYTAKTLIRTAISLPYSGGNGWASCKLIVESLMMDLKQGKRIFFFCSSANKLKDIASAVGLEFGSSKKILSYYSDSKDNARELVDINSMWVGVDLVLCTSVITVGCNFDVKDVFHKVYMYINASSSNVIRDCFQAHFRVRHLIDNELVYTVDPRHCGLAVETKRNSMYVAKMIEDHHVSHTEEEWATNMPEWLIDVHHFTLEEKTASIHSIAETFAMYLDRLGYVDGEIADESDTVIEFDILRTPDLPYHSIPSLTHPQFKTLVDLKCVKTLSDMELASIDKFVFEQSVFRLPLGVEEGIWFLYKNFGRAKFRNLAYEKSLIENEMTISDLCNLGGTHYSHVSDGLAIRQHLLENIKEWLGITCSQEWGCRVNRDSVQKVLHLFEESKDDIVKIFKLRKSRGKKALDVAGCIDMVNQVFKGWGFSHVVKDERRRMRVGSGFVDTTDFSIRPSGGAIYINPYEYVRPKKLKSVVKECRQESEVSECTDAPNPLLSKRKKSQKSK
jgi:hypothetical protein